MGPSDRCPLCGELCGNLCEDLAFSCPRCEGPSEDDEFCRMCVQRRGHDWDDFDPDALRADEAVAEHEGK
jgi:hypothetical protein